MRYLGKSTVVWVSFLTSRLKNDCPLALAADHLTILGIVRIMVAVASFAACKGDMNDLVRGTLDNEPYLLSRNVSLEEVQLLGTQLARVQVKILSFS